MFNLFQSFDKFRYHLGCSKFVRNIHKVVAYQLHTIGDDYSAGQVSIKNGGNGMYDVGNMINVPANSSNEVVYLENCQSSTVNGQPYQMALNNSGYSITLFTPYVMENISINGNLGNDGDADQYQGSWEFEGWTGFWKVVEGTPMNAGVQHLWITDAPNATHEVLSGSNKDQDVLCNVSGYNVVYIMWGRIPSNRSYRNRHEYTIENLIIQTYYSFGNIDC